MNLTWLLSWTYFAFSFSVFSLTSSFCFVFLVHIDICSCVGFSGEIIKLECPFCDDIKEFYEEDRISQAHNVVTKIFFSCYCFSVFLLSYLTLCLLYPLLLNITFEIISILLLFLKMEIPQGKLLKSRFRNTEYYPSELCIISCWVAKLHCVVVRKETLFAIFYSVLLFLNKLATNLNILILTYPVGEWLFHPHGGWTLQPAVKLFPATGTSLYLPFSRNCEKNLYKIIDIYFFNFFMRLKNI